VNWLRCFCYQVGQVNGEVQDKEADAAPAVSIAEQNFNDAFRSNKLAALQSQVAAQNLVHHCHLSRPPTAFIT
jgi:hypothetical protein